MYTRVTLVAGLTGAEMEAVMNTITDPWLPEIARQPGFLGYSVFGNPDSGRGGMSTAWESPEALKAGQEAEKGLRDAAVAAINYRREIVDETYEVLAWGVPSMGERSGKPLHMRLGRVTGLELEDVEPVREAIMNAWVPEMEQLPGFLGYSVLGNLNTLTGGMSTLWASRKALSKSAEVEERVYQAAAAVIGHETHRTVDRYEVLAWEIPTMEDREQALVF